MCFVLKHVRLCLKQVSAAYSVCSPPTCGEGLGVGVVRFLPRSRHHYLAASPPSPPSPKRGEGADRVRRLADSTPRERALSPPAEINFRHARIARGLPG